ncbi:MAG: hypothetical protein D6735_02905 [Acidobacteria bacterium]|nr:MAG: hypothetical protein D6735_02905 [Acidobacteriota bacterium]
MTRKRVETAVGIGLPDHILNAEPNYVSDKKDILHSVVQSRYLASTNCLIVDTRFVLTDSSEINITNRVIFPTWICARKDEKKYIYNKEIIRGMSSICSGLNQYEDMFFNYCLINYYDELVLSYVIYVGYLDEPNKTRFFCNAIHQLDRATQTMLF